MPTQPKKNRRRPGSNPASGEAPPSDRGHETLKLVLRTSAELFAEKGFHGASMRQLAERGGLVPSGFYYYYRSKYAVLLAIIEEALTVLEKEAAEVPTDLPPDQRLAGLLESFIRMHLTESTLARVFDREIGELKKADFNRIRSRIHDYEELFFSAIKAGKKDGTFDKGVDVPVAAKSILIMAAGVLEWWEPGGRLSAEKAGRLIAQYGLNVLRLPASK